MKKEIYQEFVLSADPGFEISAKAFITKLNDLAAANPDGSKISVGLSFTNCGYDDGGNLAIFLRREETDKEYADRIAQDKAARLKQSQDEQQRDRAKLDELAKKLKVKIID